MLDSIRGMFRVAVQSAVAAVLALGPVEWLLEVTGWNISADTIEGGLWAVTLTVVWQVEKLVLESAWADRVPFLKLVINAAMGGGSMPKYDA